MPRRLRRRRALRYTIAVPARAAMAACRNCSRPDARPPSRDHEGSCSPSASGGMKDRRPRSTRRSARESRQQPGLHRGDKRRRRPTPQTLRGIRRVDRAGRPCPRLRAKPPRSYSSPAVSMSGGKPRSRRAGSFWSTKGATAATRTSSNHAKALSAQPAVGSASSLSNSRIGAVAAAIPAFAAAQKPRVLEWRMTRTSVNELAVRETIPSREPSSTTMTSVRGGAKRWTLARHSCRRSARE